MTDFTAIPRTVVDAALENNEKAVLTRVEQAYRAHAAGWTVNPDSHFLRFPAKPDSRIIALPAFIDGDEPVVGIKWISSFPANHRRGLDRASAVLILNDYETGYPVAVLESAAISAARTAASAALACDRLDGAAASTVGVVGCGVIARATLRFLAEVGVPMTGVTAFDLDRSAATGLAAAIEGRGARTSVAASIDEALTADVVVLTTTAGTPHIGPDQALRPGQIILHLSLRDLAPELLLRANNVVDDIDHCLKANTSPHLAEQLTGNRDFISGDMAALLDGSVTLDPGRPTVFSPFGMGILDLAVGAFVLEDARRHGRATVLPDFFAGA
ncbi:ornithine cyclodeaminase [Micromonospora pattaloongensis]|uniref:Ornithine cyclodeaminase n=1 Tax=Micromonospora pattaloongensis TaxID=405436 RepID=A0A1H3JUF5_9ACTN|nr:2,3-diaminopropionate biosynthesis protein SbnB [Micromonospora pattaloongensis]SDY43543.1 ornithine cyclodeaminase [Micromonospora pattaloongensis]